MEDAPAPNFIAFGHDPDVPNPAAAAAAAVINAWALEDLSSDEDMFAPTEATMQFVKGHTVHGDVHAFSKAMTRHIQGGRMSSYDITRQVQAWAARCDDITHGVIQRIMLPHPQGFSLADRGESVVGTAAAPLLFLDIALRRAYELNPHGLGLNAGDPVPPESGGIRRQAATLEQFSAWFCRRFARVEAAREAKSQIEQKFGQTQAGEHHIQSFNDWLEKLPDDLAASLAATTHIEHFLASLSPLVPSDLEDSYDPPRKTLTDEHAAAEQGAGFASLTATQDRLLVIERPVARAARNLDLDQHWIDYAGRKLSRSDTTKAGRKKLMGAVEMGDTPLTESSSRALMAGYADSAASKVRLELGARIDAVESSVGALSTQLQSVDLKMDSMKDELLQAVRKGSKGGKGAGKGKPWQQRQQQQRWSQQPQQQQQAWSQQQQPQQQPQAPHSGWQSTVPAPAAGQSWASGRKPLACWGCGGPHMERNCPNKGTVDATRADTRHGAHVCSLALSGDDSGEATLEEVEEKFGGLEEVRGFVNAVRAQSEAIMTAAVQQGSHTARPAHPAWSLLSARLTDTLPTDTPTHTVPTQPEWNRLYVAKSLHLRPCHLLYEQHGTARLMFACDYRDSNSLGQLKDSDRLYAYVPALSHCLMTDLTDAQQLQLQLGCTEQTAPTALTAQGTEQRHLYEPLMGASRECQVVPGTTPTALLAGAGTTKVSAHPAHTALASLNACDRKSVSSTPNPVSKVNSLSRLRDSTGKLLLASKSRDDSAAVES